MFECTKEETGSEADTSAVCTRGALAAWLGNQMLLPCRAWGTPGTKDKGGEIGEESRVGLGGA